MAGFNKKAKATRSSGSNIDWEAYNNHLEAQINEATENGDEPNLVAVICGLIDSGTQPPDEKYSSYDWKDNKQQNKLLKANFGCKVEDGKFLIPNSSTDSVIIMVEFPDVMINYREFLGEDENDETYPEQAPYRMLLAGEWQGVAGITVLDPPKEGYGTKSRIMKLAKAIKHPDAKGKYLDRDFPLGELLGKTCLMMLEGVRSGDENQYFNVKATNPSSIPKGMKVPKITSEPFGVMMNSDEPNDEEDLRQIMNRRSILKRLQLAEEWEDSMLKKELEELGVTFDSSSQGKTEPDKEDENYDPEDDDQGDDMDDEEDPFAEED